MCIYAAKGNSAGGKNRKIPGIDPFGFSAQGR
jgi:hypothetical protein